MNEAPKSTMFRCLVGMFAMWGLLTSPAIAQPVNDRTLKLDVVELVKGARVEGSEEFAAAHGKFTYLFASEANMMTFVMNEERYEVQLGGACARMGPLSGEGSVRLPAAHEGKVYLFASESCRAAFLDGPERFLLQQESTPTTTEAGRALGRRMLGKAVDAVACHALIDRVSTYREVLARDEKHRETNYHVTDTLRLRRADTARWDVCWNDACWSYLAHATGGWTIDRDGIEGLTEQQCDELRRNAGRHPYMLLWNRDSSDLIASADGSKKKISLPGEGEMEIDLVLVHFQGSTSTLGLDESGLVRLLAYRGRGPNATIGDVERLYTGFHRVGELMAPGRVDVRFNGEHVPEQSGAFAEQVFDDVADGPVFIRTETATSPSQH